MLSPSNPEARGPVEGGRTVGVVVVVVVGEGAVGGEERGAVHVEVVDVERPPWLAWLRVQNSETVGGEGGLVVWRRRGQTPKYPGGMGG